MELDLRHEARAHAPRLLVTQELAEAARATWLGRMVNEYMSASVFDALALQLREAGFADDEVAQCRSFADEERMHGVLCGAVVEALGGKAVAEVAPRRRLPRHDDVFLGEAILRNLLSVSCLSETVAVALIGAERIEMPDGPLRELLTRIWADEIGHARFGWGLLSRALPACDAAAKRRLNRYLAVAFAHFEQHELTHLPVRFEPPPDGAAVGLCSGRDARALFYDTVHEVIVPRLSQLGLDAAGAWEKRPVSSLS
jgi:hypothetical protein